MEESRRERRSFAPNCPLDLRNWGSSDRVLDPAADVMRRWLPCARNPRQIKIEHRIAGFCLPFDFSNHYKMYNADIRTAGKRAYVFMCSFRILRSLFGVAPRTLCCRIFCNVI